MKPLDRVMAALYHEESDMIPCKWGVAAGLTKLEAEIARRGIKLHSDMVGVASVLEPQVIERGPGFEVFKWPFGDIRRTTFRSEYGHSGMVKPAINKPEDLDAIEPPKLDIDRVARIKVIVKEHEDYFTYIGHDSPFDAVTQHLRGFEPFLVDMVRNPAYAKKLLDFAMKSQMEIAKALIEETGVQGVWLGGDLGNARGLFISQNSYREFLYPWDRRLVDAYHKLGAFVFLHSHGNLHPILDDLIEAGFDGLNPLDSAEGMDIAPIKERYGDKITLIPQPCDYILEKIAIGDIDNYVASQLGAAAHGGGLIYYGVIVVMEADNAERYFNAVEKLRRYPLKQLS